MRSSTTLSINFVLSYDFHSKNRLSLKLRFSSKVLRSSPNPIFAKNIDFRPTYDSSSEVLTSVQSYDFRPKPIFAHDADFRPKLWSTSKVMIFIQTCYFRPELRFSSKDFLIFFQSFDCRPQLQVSSKVLNLSRSADFRSNFRSSADFRSKCPFSSKDITSVQSPDFHLIKVQFRLKTKFSFKQWFRPRFLSKVILVRSTDFCSKYRFSSEVTILIRSYDFSPKLIIFTQSRYFRSPKCRFPSEYQFP